MTAHARDFPATIRTRYPGDEALIARMVEETRAEITRLEATVKQEQDQLRWSRGKLEWLLHPPGSTP